MSTNGQLKSSGMRTDGRLMHRLDVGLLLAMHEAGASLAEMAFMLDHHPDYLARVLNEHGVKAKRSRVASYAWAMRPGTELREHVAAWAKSWMEGQNFRTIAEANGVSWEIIRSTVPVYLGAVYGLERERRTARTRTARAARLWRRRLERGAPFCKVCGAWSGMLAYCSSEHERAVNAVLRFQVSPEKRWAQNRRTADWARRNPGHSTASPETLERLATEGPLRDYAPTIHVGSEAWRWARLAWENGWPIFDQLHPRVQAIVRGEVETRRRSRGT